ncbi:MAG: EthD family reductase [Candidatus Dormibacteraeota bacterium]|nr:EthD family reductase [Candidatus Dormibacteraeota bacterium]
MVQLTVLYGQPQDAAAFDRYYQETHIPIARKMPGLVGYAINRPNALDPAATSPYHLIADLYFESQAALETALQSPEGQAAAGDVPNFATGGATLLAGEVRVLDQVTLA